MNTPLYEAARNYNDQNTARFHMPGHKGRLSGFLSEAAPWDLTEVPGLDSLYQADGAISHCEEEYARVYGASASLLSAGGSTLCIQTMLALAASPGGKVLAARGVHTAAINAMALLDLRPVWLYPDMDPTTGLAMAVTPEAVVQALDQHRDIQAVYITSPTYFGVISDVAGISAVCRSRGVPLLVDNAHGAHLAFTAPSLHPIQLGADLCCDSLHKTLPVLTGGALLHVGNERFTEHAKARMALFGSTSPNYLIMLSADMALDYIRNGLEADLCRVSQQIATLARLARKQGFVLPQGLLDPIRLTLDFGALGYTADTFALHLSANGVEPEYLGNCLCVFLAGPGNIPDDFARLEHALSTVIPSAALPLHPFLPYPLETVLTPRQAVFSTSEQIAVEHASGRIAAGMVAPCPPGIPLVAGGERVSPHMLQALKNYGIHTLDVVKLD